MTDLFTIQYRSTSSTDVQYFVTKYKSRFSVLQHCLVALFAFYNFIHDSVQQENTTAHLHIVLLSWENCLSVSYSVSFWETEITFWSLTQFPDKEVCLHDCLPSFSNVIIDCCSMFWHVVAWYLSSTKATAVIDHEQCHFVLVMRWLWQVFASLKFQNPNWVLKTNSSGIT